VTWSDFLIENRLDALYAEMRRTGVIKVMEK